MSPKYEPKLLAIGEFKKKKLKKINKLLFFSPREKEERLL